MLIQKKSLKINEPFRKELCHMEKANLKYGAYVQILKEELVPAMGCTEPIALAYAAAVARKTLGEMPDKAVVAASGSIIKNVKSVIVPNTGHLKGIPAAVAAGIVAGDPEKELEVIADVSQEQILEMRTFIEEREITVEHLDNGICFDILVTLYKGASYSSVRIADYHTNIVLIEKNGTVVRQGEAVLEKEPLTDRACLIWRISGTSSIRWTFPTLRRSWTVRSGTTGPLPKKGLRTIMVPILAKCSLKIPGMIWLLRQRPWRQPVPTPA